MQTHCTADISDMTPAQKRLLGRIADSGAPVVIVGQNQYALGDERLHHAVVGALQRRGLLVRDGDTLKLATGLEPTSTPPTATATDTTPPLGDGDPLEDDATPDEPSETVEPTNVFEDILLEDATDTAKRHALVRQADDERAGSDDAGARARDALRRAPERPAPSPRRDESIFARLWRHVDGILGS